MADDDKTEPATAKRRKDERKKGNVLMSKDSITVATLFGTSYTILALGEHILSQLEGYFNYCFTMIATGGINAVTANLSDIAGLAVLTLVNVAGPPLAVTVFVAFALTMYETKGLVTREPLKPDLSKMNPIKGLKKLFGLKNVVEALKNIIKISILLYIIYDFFMENVLSYANFYFLDPLQSASIFVDHIFVLIFRIGLAFLVIAGFDFLYQKWEYEKNMKMSKQEIKDEYKQTEGDPKVKGKIKQQQMKMAMSRMMQSVPTADVVVRNPNHFAVALRYREHENVAPMIIAMGMDAMALRIVAIAEENRVVVVENVPLARALYAKGDLNQPIPVEFYEVVAKLLSQIIHVGRQRPSGPPPPPTIHG